MIQDWAIRKPYPSFRLALFSMTFKFQQPVTEISFSRSRYCSTSKLENGRRLGTAPLLMTFNDSNLEFKVTRLFDDEYLRNGKR